MATLTYNFPEQSTKTANDTVHFYFSLQDAVNYFKNNGVVPYSFISSATVSMYGDVDTSSNRAAMAVQVSNSSGGYSQLGSSSTYLVGGKSGKVWTESINVSSWFEEHTNTSDAGSVSNSIGGANAKIHIQMDLTVLLKFNWTSGGKIDITYYPSKANVKVNGGTGSGTYEYGSTYTITATPPEGYRFVRWSDGNTSISRTFTVNESILIGWVTEKEYTAVFEKVTINKIQIGTTYATGIYLNASTKTITFVIPEAVSITPSGADTLDDYHLVISNTVPSGSTKIKGVQIGTTYVYTT